ncbi:succinoglycan biosynthesis transport protein ExoP [Bradyrhizobium sp. USDA 4474]
MLEETRPLMPTRGVEDDNREPVGPDRLFGMASLLRRRKMLTLWAAACFALGILYASKPLTYTASTQLLVYNNELHSGPPPVVSPGPADMPLVENMIQILKSPATLTGAIESLQPSEAAELIAGGPGAFLSNWLTSGSIAQADASQLAFDRALTSLRSNLSVGQVGYSHTVLVKFTWSDPNDAATISNAIARSGIQVLGKSDVGATVLDERFQGLGPSAYVISAADPPIRPDGLSRSKTVLLVTLGGLAIGVALALALDFRDRSIRTAEQLEYHLGMECLEVVPRMDLGTADGVLRRASVVIQSVRRLRSIGVTAAAAGQGATTMAARLADLMALSGSKVLVIDSVGGKRSLLPAKEAEQGGLVCSLSERRFDLRAIDGPDVAASDISWRKQIDTVVRGATPSYDFVVVDLPPLASGPQVRMAAECLDGLLLVVEWGALDAELIQRTLNLCGGARTKFVGAVLNMADKFVIGRYGDKLAGAQAAAAGGRVPLDHVMQNFIQVRWSSKIREVLK